MRKRGRFLKRCLTEAFSKARGRIELILFITALAGSFYAPSWSNDIKWPLVILVIFGVIFMWEVFVAAPYRMVTEAEERVQQLESVGLVGAIRMLALCETDQSHAGICVLLQVTNTGPPTIADSWYLTFDFESERVAFPATHSPTGEISIPDSKGGNVRLKSADMIYEKFTTPIPQGGRTSGFLFFKTKGISYQQLVSASPTVTVGFRDASKREYKTEQTQEGKTIIPLHEPGVADPFAEIYHRQRKEGEAGQTLYYKVVEKIGQDVRPITALIELGVADELDTNADVVRFCNQLVTDGHEDPFENLRIMFPSAVWQEFLKSARRKNLKFRDPLSELEYMNERLREHATSMEGEEESGDRQPT